MTESGVTIVDFNAMSEAISQYKTKVSSLQNIVSALQGIQTALQVANVFTGGAAEAIIQAIKNYISTTNKAIENLNQVIQQLQSKLEAYQQAHQEALNIANTVETAQWSEV